MHCRKAFCLVASVFLLLAGCAPAGEPQTGAVQKRDGTLLTAIKSEGIGEIAVLIRYPAVTRFPEGAGVVVIVPSFLAGRDGFTTTPDFTSLGLIQVTCLLPGGVDARLDARSEGEYDYGGAGSLHALRDVIRFAAGLLPNVEGRALTTLLPIKPLVDEVGLYAHGEAGLSALAVLARYGTELTGVEYYVGHENPTVDSLISREAGHIDTEGLVQQNPFYRYPATYSPTAIALNFGSLRWDSSCSDPITSLPGCPYLDLDGDESLSPGDHAFPAFVQMFDKRYYSSLLTRALLDNGALTAETWPATLATPAEADEAWSSLLPASRYRDLVLQKPDLKVMLVFARADHAQAAADKPHIHQAFQGFRFEALLRWVRLNPDRAYLQQASGSSSKTLPDNPANTQPEDWLKIADWAYAAPELPQDAGPLAALAEMSDRAHTGRWDENLGDTLYEYNPAPPQP